MNNLNINKFSEENSEKEESNAISIEGNVLESNVISGSGNTVNIFPSDEQISSTWELLFENDRDGNPINGDLERLIQTVHRGYPIRIKIHLPKDIIKVIDGESVHVDNGIVHAANTKEISLRRDESGNYMYQEKPYHYYVIASSNGHFHERRIFLDGKERNTTNRRRSMAWFGLVPSKK